MFANGKRHFQPFMKFYVIYLKKLRVKNLIIIPL